MNPAWFSTNLEDIASVFVSATGILVVTIVAIRVTGLRSLSKMSSFDFGVTVSIGSIMAGVAATDASFSNGAAAVVALLGVQWVISQIRLRYGGETLVDNSPVLLMDGSTVIEENLRRTRVTRSDIRAKLREANVTDPDQILAVVLETTGDVSVLHGDGPLDPSLLDGVQRPTRR